MGEIITRKRGQAPALQTPEMRHLAEFLRSRLEPVGTTSAGMELYSISSSNAPTRYQRSALKGRCEYLIEALTVQLDDRASVGDKILTTFYCWSEMRRMPTDKLAETAAKFVAVLSKQPLWAVVIACEQAADLDSAWPPSPGEMRAMVWRITAPFVKELAYINQIFNAKVYKAIEVDERARINKEFSRLLQNIAETNAMVTAGSKPKARADQSSSVDKPCISDAQPTCELSAEALHKAGVRRREPEDAL